MASHAKHDPGDARRSLPSVSALLQEEAIAALLALHPRAVVVEAIRGTLDALRATVTGESSVPPQDEILRQVCQTLEKSEGERLRPVINATGIILHTGLGRAVLPQRTVDALAGLNRCCNMQIDLETGLRGKRSFVTEKLLCRLTGAEAAAIVNNNAAATLLILAALCKDRDVIVSRGQLIEIGGSYRLPDCIHESGARLVEVGTTNKTHLRDYESALTDDTAAVMRVNPSNYRIVGFTKEVPVEDLVTLKEDHPDLIVIDDLGCGALVPTEQYGLPHEPTAPESIAAGADIVCFSGDKMIGGPQSGIIAGRKDLIARIKKHPLSRMLRVDKLTDLALEQTLRLFLDPESLPRENPTWRMITADPEQLRAAAESLAARIATDCPSLDVDVAACASKTGGGSLPATDLPSFAVSVRAATLGPESLARHLRKNEPPVIVRIEDNRVLLDVRTLLEGEDEEIVEAFTRIAGPEGEEVGP